MRIEASLEEWKELYDIAIKIKDMRPWKELKAMDLITIFPYGKDEPCICSVMGKGGEYYGIGVYIGVNAIHDFFLMANNTDIPQYQLIRYQNNIVCNFGDGDELTKKELNMIRELGFKFRGNGNWIYFRAFETGYAPYMPNRSEVLELTDILKQLHKAIEALQNGLEIDFESGNTLMRSFDEESNSWINYEMPLFIPEIEYLVPEIEDELLIKRLKKKPLSSSILELDIAYLNQVVEDKNYDKPIILRLCILADSKSGMLLSETVLDPEDDGINIVLETIINYIFENERPKLIMVRDMYIFNILSDLCEKVGIDIIQSGRLPGIDRFVETFSF